MGILGIGVDLVHIPRILRVLTRAPGRADHFARRILTPKERKEMDKAILEQDDFIPLARYLALRWAAKEAAYKAAYPTCRLTWQDVEVIKVSGGAKPALFLHPRCRSQVGPSHLSISHDGDHLIAQVLLETP